HALEADDPLAPELAAVEPHVVGAEPGGEGDYVDELLAEAGDLHPELPGAGLPVEGEEAVAPLHPAGLLRDGGERVLRGRGGGRREEEGEQEGCEPALHGSRDEWGVEARAHRRTI